MTDEQLADLEKACAEATPGPWRTAWTTNHVADIVADGMVLAQVLSTNTSADARLIVVARSWVPELVAEIRKLRKDKEAMCKVLYGPNRPLEKAVKVITGLVKELSAAQQGLEWCADVELLIENLVREEREACAKLAETLVNPETEDIEAIGWAKEIAKSIRARGTK